MTSTIGNTLPWDLLVVGGGTAGLVGARTAAALGARVALAERARTGGECLWTGCVPSKALLAAAATVVGRGDVPGMRYGVPDFAAAMAHVRQTIGMIQPVDSAEALERAGVTVLPGTARFTGARSLTVDGVEHRFRHALVATGSTARMPSVPGLGGVQPLTNDTVWDLATLPRRLVVLGGGSIGCELAQAFARLGADVTVVETASRVLPAEDPDAGAAVRAALEADGVTVLPGHRPVEVVGTGAAGRLRLAAGGAEAVVAFDRLLVATGRRPRTEDLGLDRAAVEVGGDGYVRVDERLRTTNHRVWAAGDATGPPQFTHVAGMHASVAASNAVLGLRRRVDASGAPRVTFTDPEVAAVGRPSWTSAGQPPRTVTLEHQHIDRAITDARTDGFTRLVLDRRRRIVGATLVGPRAGESLGEVALAVRQGLRTGDITGVVHPYPTYSDGVWNAAIADTRARLASPAVHLLTAGVARARRLWR